MKEVITETPTSEELVAIREGLGKTQFEMAHDLLNTPVGTYRKWERKSHSGGRRVPGMIVPALNFALSQVKE